MSKRTWGIILKVFSCTIFFLVAAGNLYFAIEGAITHRDDLVSAIVNLVIGLLFSGLGFLFFYGALNATPQELVISARLLLRHGYRRMKTMSAEEYERLAKLEKSIDAEISELKQRRR